MVLDASALLALLLNERGADRVKNALDGAFLCAVNLGEVVTYYAKLGVARDDVTALLRPLPVRIVPADAELSYSAGMLRAVTIKQGLSIGDRYCLALAKRDGLPALTAERRWPEITAATGVTIELIR